MVGLCIRSHFQCAAKSLCENRESMYSRIGIIIRTIKRRKPCGPYIGRYGNEGKQGYYINMRQRRHFCDYDVISRNGDPVASREKSRFNAAVPEERSPRRRDRWLYI